MCVKHTFRYIEALRKTQPCVHAKTQPLHASKDPALACKQRPSLACKQRPSLACKHFTCKYVCNNTTRNRSLHFPVYHVADQTNTAHHISMTAQRSFHAVYQTSSISFTMLAKANRNVGSWKSRPSDVSLVEKNSCSLL